MASPRVFVSHSHHDDAFTYKLANDLKSAGAQVWVDVADVGAGDFLDRINSGLASCEWVVLVLTKDALNSPWVKQEINAAIRLKHRGRIQDIIPVQAGPVDDDDIPALWGVFNFFDATNGYVLAKDALLKTLGLAPDTGASVSKFDTASSAIHMTKLITRLQQRTHTVHGSRRYRNEDYVSALQHFNLIIRMMPNDAMAWVGKAEALRALGRLDEAEEAEQRAKELGWKGK